jgi:hypothetical protein
MMMMMAYNIGPGEMANYCHSTMQDPAHQALFKARVESQRPSKGWELHF